TLTELRETPEGQSERSAVIDFTGNNRYVKLTASGITVVGDIELNGPFNITRDGAWQITLIKLKVDSTSGLKIDGTAKLKTPRALNGPPQGESAEAEHTLKVKITPAEAGRTEEIRFDLQSQQGF